MTQTQKHEGIIKFYAPEKGFGFVTDSTTREEFYFNSYGLINPLVSKGEKVKFNLESNPRGNKAVNIEVIS